MNWLRVSFVLILCSFLHPLWAQVPQVYIEAIELEGLKKTKASLVYHELDIRVGDSLSLEELMPALERNKRYLVNTLLFRSVAINIAHWEGQSLRLRIDLLENWYIFPLPQFELADRNFNVWWTRHKHDFRRTNIGLWLVWRNLSGYNDLLKAIVQFGYTRKFELEYTLPPMGHARKFGFTVNALYSDTKEIAYQTFQNKLLFYNNYGSRERQHQRIRGHVAGFYRPTLLQQHHLQLTFLQLRISPSALALNNNFFQIGQNLQRTFSLSYSYRLDQRDVRAYPLNGYFIGGSINKKGLGIFNDVNLWELWGHVEYFKQLGKRLSLGFCAKGQWRLGEQPSYYNNRALGFYENYVRGYQYYVIDGQGFVLLQGDFNFKVLDFCIPLFKKAPKGYLSSLPLRLYLRYHFDYGRVWDAYYSRNNSLSNTDLIGTGFGLDFIFYAYNIIVQFEYTFNKSGEKGLYLRYKFNF